MPIVRFLLQVSRAVNAAYRITVVTIVGYQTVKHVWKTEKEEKEERDRQKQQQQEQEDEDNDQDQ